MWRVRIWLPRAGATTAALGLILVTLGTFLPWSRSGSVFRDSYQSLGVMRELGFVDAFPALGVFLDVWIGMIPVVAITIAVYALGFHRSAAVVACIVAIIMGTIGGAIVVQGVDKDGLIGLAGTGPTVTAAGACAALAGAVTVLVTRRKSTKRETEVGGAS
jgi:hypothetical protein